MRRLLWLGLFLTSSSWLFLIPIYNIPDDKIGIFLLTLGTICIVFSFWDSKPFYFKERYWILLIPLILSIFFIAYPFNIGIILLTIGFVFSILFHKNSQNTKTNLIFKGISLTGFILILQAVLFPIYKIFESHFHRIDFFSTIISPVSNLFGLKTSVNSGIVFVQTFQQTYPFTITLEKLGFFMWLNMFIGAIAFFVLFYILIIKYHFSQTKQI